ncbi:MAG: CoA transferase, partial [Gemmataceae bacterium]|nr:CoA transferase [Gemmataceae bacterium]
MAGPLTGVNVLDFGQAGVGPWSASLLGFLGANVLKIERPEGDTIRSQQPTQRGLAVAYTVWNMSKKGAILNLKDPRSRTVIDPLIQQADVIVENLRPRVMDRLGLGFQAVKELNPKIVYASSPGWGATGPMASLPGVDADFQAFSGFASISGDEGGRPEMARHLYHFDLTASCNLANSMVLGLIRRDRLGTAQQVGCSHLASTMSQLSSRAAEYLLTGAVPGTLGSAAGNTAPHQAFQCLGGGWLAVGCETEEQWQGFCKAIRREDLQADPRFASNQDRVANRRALSDILTPLFASRPTSWWGPKLTRFGVPNGLFLDFEALRYHQQVVENGYMVEMDVPHQGPIAVGGIPWHFSHGEGQLYHGPAPGQDTEAATTQGFGMFGPQATRRAAYARPLADDAPPLSGLRVIDASQGLTGPYAALLLADAGAEVIKVEPVGGDYARRFAPATAPGNSAAFEALNRNKQ